MFGMFKNKTRDTVKKLDGSVDTLEAFCAGAAMVVSADGEVSKDEEDKLFDVAKQLECLKSFNENDITNCLVKMINYAKGGRLGRANLNKEIEDLANQRNNDKNMSIFYALCDLADSGGMDQKEKDVLKQIATKLSINNADKIIAGEA